MPDRELLAIGIESTAHTFSVAVVSLSGKILSNVRQVYRGEEGTGIHPGEASRHHAAYAGEVLRRSLKKAGIKAEDADIICYSAGPGLGPCLRVGAVVARAISSYLGKPVIPVNHAVGHIELGCLLTGAKDPVCLLVSGGHTAILASRAGKWRFFGETLDITVGQLFDQFGRELKFPSPCGPQVEMLAENGEKYLKMPYTVKGNDLSFSGLLTFAKKLVGKHKVEDVAYSMQETAFSMLCEATERALAFTQKKELLVVGGVAANRRLAEMLSHVCIRQSVELHVPPVEYSGDCGAQIAWTGIRQFLSDSNKKADPEHAFVKQRWRVDEVEIPWRD